MIDWDSVAQLRDDVGPEPFDDVVALFFEEVDEVIARLKTEKHHAGLSDDLHFLKGSALNLGFVEFAEQCRDDGQRIARNGPGAVDLVALIDCYVRSREKFLLGLGRRAEAG